MLKSPKQKTEEARQWVVTYRLLFVVAALSGLVAALAVQRLL